MFQIGLRVLVGIGGFLGLLGAASFMIDPEKAAKPLGLVAKGIVGIATLRGDFTALFGVLGGLALAAAILNRRGLLVGPVVVLGCALAGRAVTMSMLGGGAEQVQPMFAEATMLAICGLGMSFLSSKADRFPKQ